MCIKKTGRQQTYRQSFFTWGSLSSWVSLFMRKRVTVCCHSGSCNYKAGVEFPGIQTFFKDVWKCENTENICSLRVHHFQVNLASPSFLEVPVMQKSANRSPVPQNKTTKKKGKLTDLLSW